MRKPKSAMRHSRPATIPKDDTGWQQNSERSELASFFKLRLLGWLLLQAGLGFAAFGQSYSIDWYTIDGGGGTSTGGVYSVSGTIGQPDAGAPMTGGQYSLTGGFWSIYAVQTPGAPLLKIFLTSTNTAVVSWPSPSTGWNLQQTLNLSTTNWTVPAESIGDDATNRFIIVSPPTGNRFYRLAKP